VFGVLLAAVQNLNTTVKHSHTVQAGNVQHHSARNNGRNSTGIALAYSKVATPVGFFETVVPVIVLADSDMRKTVDLCCDVVADE